MAEVRPGSPREDVARLLGGLRGEERSDALTAREMEVLRRIARGQSNRAIASELYISDQTVKTHVSNLLSKLQVEDRRPVLAGGRPEPVPRVGPIRRAGLTPI